MKFLTSLFARKTNLDDTPFDAALAPERAKFVVGDVHGCVNKLGELLKQRPEDADLIFVGDIIDRGPDVRASLERVFTECSQGAVCLIGNHERMMLDFLDRPTERASRWLRFGGLQTLYSFKVPRVAEKSDLATLEAVRDSFREKLGSEMEEWLQNLPLIHSSGNLHIVHAAADPNRPISEQSARDLLWGHKQFFKQNRQDGQWICHGHTIVKEPKAENGRISVDTGAFATDRLTAALITPEEVRFVSV